MDGDFPTRSPSCVHTPVGVGRFEVVACDSCGVVDWYESGRPCDAAVGMAGLFGQFDLVGRLPALNAPGREVLLYKPPRARDRRALHAFSPQAWYRVGEDLWLCHDGSLLMLAPTDPLLVANLTRGA